MHKEFLMGNAAIALGAVAAGVNVVAGYPGTPSTEVLETVAKYRPDDIYVEWSVNEKAAMELAAGAAYAGARSLVTMKQVGLNVASDPLMSLEYVGVKGGMVIIVADDPGPISSQTEQDTRHFSRFSKLPCFDPSSAQEAYEMIQEAFEYSEKYKTPVFLRPTTRVCHGYATIDIKDKSEYYHNKPEGFIKDSKRWVIFPKLSFMIHQYFEARNKELSDVFSSYEKNKLIPTCDKYADSKKGIASGGISYTYAMETLKETGMVRHLKVSTPHPFPEKLAVEFLTGLDEVLCLEELDPVIERELIYICGKYHLNTKIIGKLSGDTACAGENTRDSVSNYIHTFLGLDTSKAQELPEPPALPVRPPVLCAGCPHRASFYAVKTAMKGKKTIFCGDIGCYTLGAVAPLSVVDTTICMGASISSLHGMEKAKGKEYIKNWVAVIGDSTFLHTGVNSLMNMMYNKATGTVMILDNSTTGMTGHQDHAATGKTLQGDPTYAIDIPALCRAIGVKNVIEVNAFDIERLEKVIKEEVAKDEVSVIITKTPCVLLSKKKKPLYAEEPDKCKKCGMCMKPGCPAMTRNADKTIHIDDTMCTGCGLCKSLCKFDAIKLVREGDK